MLILKQWSPSSFDTGNVGQSGDGLMVYFGAPLPQADHAFRAVHCALEMMERLEKLNQDQRHTGRPLLNMGIGIHTGPAIVGSMGASHRQDYTAIGSTVNLAARLEQLTKEHGRSILVSKETREAAGQAISFSPCRQRERRGIVEPVALFAPKCMTADESRSTIENRRAS